MRILLSVAASILLVAILRPWSVRPIERDKRVAFDPATFASSAWPRLVREANETAVDISDFVAGPDGPPSQARFVKGVARVTEVDRRSRVGVALMRLVGSKPAAIAMQIGPVIRGTALRDASGFIQFSDFTNQSDYAAAANALNESALRFVIGPLQFERLSGQVMTFVAAVGRSPLREDGAIEIVPVRIGITSGAQ